MPSNSPIRILFVRPTLGQGGADRVTVNILKYIDRKRFVPELALMKKEGVFCTDIPGDIVVHDLGARDLYGMVWPLRNLIKSKDYDYLYSTCGGAGIPLLIAALLARVKTPVIVSERNILFPPHRPKWKQWVIFWLKRYLYSKATFVTAVSEGVADEIRSKLKIPSEKIRVVNNPIITDDFNMSCLEPVDHPVFHNGKPVVLAAGRLVIQKDFPTLLRAFSKVTENHKATLFILGEGPLEGKLKGLATELGIEGEVVFGGFDKNPLRFMARCTIYVLSSLHEGMPGTLIQAMACGAACISTDCHYGPSELIKNGLNGSLTPIGDIQSLSNCMHTLLKDRKMREGYRSRSAFAVQKFHYKEALLSYLDFLN